MLSSKILIPLLLLLSSTEALFSIHDDIYARPKFKIRYIEENPIPVEKTVKLIDENNSNSSASSSSALDRQKQGTFELIRNLGKNYLCYIPTIRQTVDQQENKSNANDTNDQIRRSPEKELESVKARALEIVSSALQFKRIVPVPEIATNQGQQQQPINEKTIKTKMVVDSCIYKTINYWTYKFCYNDSITQFHERIENGRLQLDPGAPTFLLSQFSGDSAQKQTKNKNTRRAFNDDRGSKRAWKPIELVKDDENGGSLNLVQHLSGGDECDLTGRKRAVDVKYICDTLFNSNVAGVLVDEEGDADAEKQHEQLLQLQLLQSSKSRGGAITKKILSNGDLQKTLPLISWLKEYKTCQYEMVISVPELCQLEEFNAKADEKINEIECQRVADNVDIDGEIESNEEAENINRNEPLGIAAERIVKNDFHIIPLGGNLYAGIAKKNQNTTPSSSGNPLRSQSSSSSSSSSSSAAAAAAATAKLFQEREDILLTSDPSVVPGTQVINLSALSSAILNGIRQNIIVNKHPIHYKLGDTFSYVVKLYNFQDSFVGIVHVKMEQTGKLWFRFLTLNDAIEDDDVRSGPTTGLGNFVYYRDAEGNDFDFGESLRQVGGVDEQQQQQKENARDGVRYDEVILKNNEGVQEAQLEYVERGKKNDEGVEIEIVVEDDGKPVVLHDEL